MIEDKSPEELQRLDLDQLKAKIYRIKAEAALRQERIKREQLTPEEKLLRAIFGKEEEEDVAKHASETIPNLGPQGIFRMEMRDDLTVLEFIEIMRDFNDAYASIRFLLRKFSSNYSELYELLSFPPVNQLPTFAQPTLVRAHFNSPGFWEALANLNPLKVLCDYLQQRHERKKDNNYRNAFEEQRLALENLKLRNELIDQQIKSMKEVGFSDEEIKELLSNYIADPLEKLGKRIDSGQITSVDASPLYDEEKKNEE
ncbi:MAG: hypothetical protein Q8K52_10180 [Thiobacillus sp.]|nr:hypothetical protein [Thiobacillus sp.]